MDKPSLEAIDEERTGEVLGVAKESAVVAEVEK